MAEKSERGENLSAEPLSNRSQDRFSSMPKSELQTRIAKEKYFHDMQLAPDIRTGSWIYPEPLPPNYHLWPTLAYLDEIDLNGRTCLDLGTFDGLTAFVMAEKGAAEVDATCEFDLDRLRLVRAFRGYKTINYFPNTDLELIARTFQDARYDVVVLSAMLHHLTSPLDALMQVRRLLKTGGLLVIEAAVLDRPYAALLLNSELPQPVVGAPTVFIPTIQGLKGLLKFACLEVFSETRLLGTSEGREPNFERMTIVAKAVRPSELTSRSTKLQEIQKLDRRVGVLNFPQIDRQQQGSSTVIFRGTDRPQRTMNIWLDTVDYPLRPPRMPTAPPLTLFTVARERDFTALVEQHPDGAFTWQDVHLLGARYPGETMPEGMTWSIKQLGNLHILDCIKRLGLAEVLEVGPGFNLYFVNHLPVWCKYTGLDSSGFYDADVLSLANKARKGRRMVEGVLGGNLPNDVWGQFDACISVSVLEHVPSSAQRKVCDDMFKILRPGGWALHSIDLLTSQLADQTQQWLNHLQNAGFEIASDRIDSAFGGTYSADSRGEAFLEPLSIRARFHHGYRPTIWDDPKPNRQAPVGMVTILVAARKPAG